MRAVFDRVDRGGDVVRAGAFAAALKRGAAVPLLGSIRRGGRSGGCESMREDRRGLRVIGRVVDGEAAALLRAGAVTGLSFGYRVREAKGADRGSYGRRAGRGEPGDLSDAARARVHAVI
jgi:HK97 family phage prohead protease